MKKAATCNCPSCGRVLFISNTVRHPRRPFVSCDFCDTFTWLDTGEKQKRTLHEDKRDPPPLII